MEAIINELAVEIIGIVVAICIAIIAYVFRRLVKIIESWLGIDIVNNEADIVVSTAMRIMEDENEIVEFAVSNLRQRLKKKGIEINDDELYEIIVNFLEDYKSELN